MALKLPLKARGGFEAPEGYRRAAALHVEFVSRSIATGAADYKDVAVRQAEPNNTLGTASYSAGPTTQPRRQEPVGRNPDGSLQLDWKEGTPSYSDVLGKPISEYLTITDTTTAEDVLKAIAYSHMKTSEANQNAINV